MKFEVQLFFRPKSQNLLKCPDLVFYPTPNAAILGSPNTLFIKALEVKFQKNHALRAAPSAPLRSATATNQFPQSLKAQTAPKTCQFLARPLVALGESGGGGVMQVFDLHQPILTATVVRISRQLMYMENIVYTANVTVHDRVLVYTKNTTVAI